MKTNKLVYIKNIILPCFVISGIAGFFVGVIIFLYKLLGTYVIELSGTVYSAVRERPVFLPLLLLGVGIIAVISAVILNFAPECKGGGIPGAVSILRGYISIKWKKCLSLLPITSFLTFLVGVPLGNEGPSVQLGTVGGYIASKFILHKNGAWDRYIMTGGASAGFAAATGAPISGILFAFEETHRRFSPMIFMVSSIAVVTSSAVMQVLGDLFNTEFALFSFQITEALPTKLLWVGALVGIVIGFISVLFSKLYTLIGNVNKKTLKNIPLWLKLLITFALTALLGFAYEGFIGSGHHYIEKLLCGDVVWYLIILTFSVRAILLMFANTSGASGGLFVPTLTFGALLGALNGEGLVALGWLDEKYFMIVVVISMASFLASTSKTPITALAFSVEALSGANNLLPIAMGVAFSYLIIETCGVTTFTDAVIENTIETTHENKKPVVVDTLITVKPGAFCIGKEVRDLLLIPTLTILSIRKNKIGNIKNPTTLCEGDILHIHYQTYEEAVSFDHLEDFFGKQEKNSILTHPISKNHHVPE